MKSRSMTFQPLVFILFFCLFMPMHALGQTDGASDSTIMSDEMMLFQEIPSVYSASKYEQKVTEAPSSVSIITADEIKKYGYRNFAEIMTSIRGFYITNDRNYFYLGVRGFGLPGDYNSRVLLLIDGIRVNDNVYDSAGIGSTFHIDIDLIERIEVVRGPSSSLYGRSAVFGVINVITRKGRDVKGLEVSGSAGSFETYQARLTYGNRFQNGLEVFLSGSYHDSEGDDRLFYRAFDDPSTNNGVAEDLDYDRYWHGLLRLTYQDFTLSSNYSYRKKGVPTASFETVFNDDSYFTVDEQFWVDLKYEHTYEGQLHVLGRLNYNYYKYYGDYPYDWADPGDPPDIVINKDYAKGQWVHGELKLTKPLMEKHKVTLGLEYENSFEQDQKNYDAGFREDGIYLDNDSYHWAVFLQDEFTISNRLILNAGVRYDDYETFGDTINPRLALIYSPVEKTTLKIVYGSAFRAPNVYELFFEDGGASQKGNPDLDPETIDTYELILEQYLGTNLRGTIVGYYYTVDDLITAETDPADDLIVFNNVEDIEAKGLEFELEGKWPSGLQGRISYTYQDTENKETGRTLANSPEHLAKLNVIIPLWREKIYLGIEEQYTGERKTLSGNDTEDFFITNITLFGKDILKNLEFSASVYNLFDEEYADPGTEEHEQDEIEQDDRTFRIKLTYIF